MTSRVIRSLILFGLPLLIACGNGIKGHWTPYSAVQSFEPTLKSCVLFYEGDIERIKSVGGVYAGKVTIHGRRAETKSVNDARENAAHHGGTHCVAVSAETWAATRAAFLDAYPSVNAVVPVTEPRDSVTLLVVHVPEANWPKLPAELRPQRPTQEFQW